MATHFRQLSVGDQGLLVSAVLVVAFAFAPYYGASFGQESTWVTAWHGWTFVGLLLLIVAAGLAAMQIFARSSLPEAPLSWNGVVAGLAAIGTSVVIIHSLRLDSGSFLGVHYGLRYGAWLVMGAAAAEVLFAVLRIRGSSEPTGYTATPASDDSTASPWA